MSDSGVRVYPAYKSYIPTPPGLRVGPLLPVGGIIHTKKRFVIHRRFTGGEGTLVINLF